MLILHPWRDHQADDGFCQIILLHFSSILFWNPTPTVRACESHSHSWATHHEDVHIQCGPKKRHLINIDSQHNAFLITCSATCLYSVFNTLLIVWNMPNLAVNLSIISLELFMDCSTAVKVLRFGSSSGTIGWSLQIPSRGHFFPSSDEMVAVFESKEKSKWL